MRRNNEVDPYIERRDIRDRLEDAHEWQSRVRTVPGLNFLASRAVARWEGRLDRNLARPDAVFTDPGQPIPAVLAQSGPLSPPIGELGPAID